MKLTQNVAIAILKAAAKNDWTQLIDDAAFTLENALLFSYTKDIPQHIIDLGVKVGKIAAVKQFRAETGLDLKNSIDILVTYFTNNRLEFKGFK